MLPTHRSFASRLLIVSILSFAVACPTISFAQSESQSRVDAQLSNAESIAQATLQLETLRDDFSIPGLSVAVAVDDQIVWSEGFGYSDLENRVLATPLTRFRIASISKPVTAAALALLFESGDLDLDAPVQSYVPYFPEKRWPVTVRQVAGHIGGIRHYRGNEFASNTAFRSVRDAISVFATDTLLFEPGTRYSYSSFGWNLISAVVEGASGNDFLTFMKENVFDPLGLRSITPEYADSLIAYRASFYLVDESGRTQRAPFVDNSIKWAGGGFMSNAEDLALFGSAHLRNDFLEAKTVELFTQSQSTTDGKETGYGIGWVSGRDAQGRKWFGHSGGAMGGRTMLVVYPDTGIAVAILSNSGNAPVTAHLAHRIGDLFSGSTPSFPMLSRNSVSPPEFVDVAGEYVDLDGEPAFSVTLEKGNPVIRSSSGDKAVLYPENAGTFFYLYGPEVFVFGTSADGEPTITSDDLVFTRVAVGKVP